MHFFKKANPLTGIFISFTIFLTGCYVYESNTWEIKSPDGDIIVELNLNRESGEIFYQAKFKRELKYIIEKSRLGFSIDNENYYSSLEMLEQLDGEDGVEAYALISGKNRNVSAPYKEYKFELINSAKNKFKIVFKIFNDGFGFRYEVDEILRTSSLLTDERTTFNVPSDGKAWIQPYDEITKWTPAYEKPYTNASAVGVKAEKKYNGWCFPLLFEVEKSWILISEAGITENNCAMHVDVNEQGEYAIVLPVETEAYELFQSEPTISFPWKSTWRAVIMTKSLKDLFKSNIVTSLSDMRIRDDFEWVNPGIASWSWWSDSESPTDFLKVKKFIDLAFEMGWKYSLIDANWNHMIGGTIPELVEYANRRNVGLLLWYNSGGPHNIVEEEPRDLMLDPLIRKQEFERISKLGIKGIKVDFFQTDKQPIIKQYIDILKDASEFEILVNFHGCTMPRGWSRTYPNLVSMEAVRGAESYKFAKDYPAEAVLLNTIYPFTRNVIGSMDYTPLVLSESNYEHLTSLSHEVATAIVFESGITHVAESYEVLKRQPDFVINYLKELPTAWDESELLYGYPGVEIGIARRDGDKWFVGGLNSQNLPSNIEFDLDFLDEISYEASIISDGTNNRSYNHLKQTVSNGDKLEIAVLPYGGYTIEFTPMN